MSVPIADSDRALVTLVPHTTLLRQTRFEAVVPTHFLKPGAFDAQGLLAVPAGRAIRLLGKLDAPQLRDVEEAVRRWLGYRPLARSRRRSRRAPAISAFEC